MYLIEETVETLQKFFDKEPSFQEMEAVLSGWDCMNTEDSTWRAYEAYNFESPVRQYKIESPVQLVDELQKLWKDNEVLGDAEFIKTFVVSAFRQTMEMINPDEKMVYRSDTSIPTYIYNF